MAERSKAEATLSRSTAVEPRVSAKQGASPQLEVVRSDGVELGTGLAKHASNKNVEGSKVSANRTQTALTECHRSFVVHYNCTSAKCACALYSADADIMSGCLDINTSMMRAYCAEQCSTTSHSIAHSQLLCVAMYAAMILDTLANSLMQHLCSALMIQPFHYTLLELL
jgi:hypothetical protein